MTESDRRLLLVEDNPADVDLFRHALEESEIQRDVHVEATGEGALAILDAEDASDDEGPIALVVLDLDLPDRTGLEVLEQLKRDRRDNPLPVLVFSSSKNERDIREAYKLGANAYVVKKAEFEDLMTFVKLLEEFWFELADLPD